MQLSDWGLQVIKSFEGFRAKPYYCSAGVLTQGYGHTAAAGGEPIGGVWTREKAAKVLADDLERVYSKSVREAVAGYHTTQAQFDAMVSFAYNCGVGALKASVLLRRHKKGDYTGAAAAFMNWVNAGGKPNKGLIRRRASEALMYSGVKDLDFDGKRDADEPVYGTMPQVVTPRKPKAIKSRSLQTATATGGAGVVMVAKEAQGYLESAQAQMSTGSVIGLTIGAITIGLAVYAVYVWMTANEFEMPWARGRA